MTFAEEKDAVSVGKEGGAMGNSEDAPFASKLSEKLAEEGGVFGVEGSAWLIKEEKRSVFEEDTSERETLQLSCADGGIAFAERSIETMRKAREELVKVSAFESGVELGGGGGGTSGEEIFAKSAAKESGMLRKKSEVITPSGRGEGGER